MKKLMFVFALVSTSAMADQALLTKNNCMACHAIDTKLVGPAYKDVAKKYQGQKDAVDVLAKKIRAGGGGVWGTMPMPAHPQISEVDAKKMASFVLNSK